MKEIKIAPAVTLPALSTEIGEREYKFSAFIVEFMLMSPKMREDSALESLFALEDIISANTTGELEDFQLEDNHWEVCKKAAKEEIDARMAQSAANPLPLPWAMKILRHYHAFAQAKTVDAKTVEPNAN